MQALGAVVIYWTYDPLVARNAHLNFNVFGVRVAEYVEGQCTAKRTVPLPRHRHRSIHRRGSFLTPTSNIDLGKRTPRA